MHQRSARFVCIAISCLAIGNTGATLAFTSEELQQACVQFVKPGPNMYAVVRERRACVSCLEGELSGPSCDSYDPKELWQVIQQARQKAEQDLRQQEAERVRQENEPVQQEKERQRQETQINSQ